MRQAVAPLGSAISRTVLVGKWTTGMRVILYLLLVAVPLRQQTPFAAASGTLFGIVLVALAATDLQRRLIPNRVVLPAILVAFVASVVMRDEASSLMGAVTALLFMLLVSLFRRGGLGGGDVKMGTLAGAVVGYPGVIYGGTIMCLAGGLVALALVSSGRANRTDALPYGPFIALGALTSLLR